VVDLNGRVIVVTGAASGLGASISRAASTCGAQVALLDIDESGAQEQGRAAAGRAIRCDVGSVSDVAAAAAAVEAEFGHVDGLVNCAGVFSPAWATLDNVTLDEWDRLYRTNLLGTLLCMQEFGRLMLRKGAGSIVNIASVGGLTPQPLGGAYSVTKAGVIMLTRQAGLEWGSRGIRCNAVSPGTMDTELTRRLAAASDRLEQRERSLVSSGRLGHPDEVASTVAWLLSDSANYINCQNIVVDGGMTNSLLGVLPGPGQLTTTI